MRRERGAWRFWLVWGRDREGGERVGVGGLVGRGWGGGRRGSEGGGFGGKGG